VPAPAWIGGLAILAAIFGAVAQSAAGNVAVEPIEQQVSRLGGHPGGATTAWIEYEFPYLAALFAFAAAAQISAARGEEADGPPRQPVGTPAQPRRLAPRPPRVRRGTGPGRRRRHLNRRGGPAWRHRVRGDDAAGRNAAVPGLFILGVGTLLYGLLPRLAVPILYAVILWSFLIEVIGSTVTSNH